MSELAIFANGKGQKSYIEELAKDKHYLIIEFPKLVADWVVQVGVFKETASVFSKGLSKITSSESLNFLAGDVCEYPTRISNLSNRLVAYLNEDSDHFLTERFWETAHEVRRLGCLIGGTVSDWADSCDFFKNISVLKNTNQWFVPAQIPAKIGGMMQSLSKIYDISSGLLITRYTKTPNETINSAKKELAQGVDRWDMVQWGSVFTINAVGLAAILTGSVLFQPLSLMCATSIFASRMASHYNGVKLSLLDQKSPEIKEANNYLRH